MSDEKLFQLADTFEKLELENAASGIPVPALTYSQLLAIYLYRNDQASAKFLWKRIPAAVKNNKELENVWKVGQKILQRDFPGIYIALSEPWSPDLAEIMENIRVAVRERAAKLVATAYSFISIDALAKLTGLSPSEAEEHATAAGWQVNKETKMVKPIKPTPPPVQSASCEQQLSKLTDFVSFLEN